MAFAPASPLTLDGMPKFFSFIYHRFLNATMFTFAELGIADIFNETPSGDLGLTVNEIVNNDRSQWNSDLLYRVLRASIDIGLVERMKNADNDDNEDERFVLTTCGKMLTSSHPSHARDLIRLYLGPFVNLSSSALPDLVRNRDLDVNHAMNGQDFFTFINQPEQQALSNVFLGAMGAYSAYNADKLAKAVDFSRFESVVDVGGCEGGFLAEILQQYPAISRGVVFDLPSVVAHTCNTEVFSSRKIDKARVTFIGGDMFDPSTIPPADAYVLKHVLHDYGDERAVAILISLRKASEKNTVSPTVFIVEHVILADGSIGNWQAHAFDVAMGFAVANARERTEKQYSKLLEQAGFKLKHFYPVQAPNSIIEAVISE